MKAIAVIGANFGDEGKGLATDYFCSKLDNPIVVRFNGGANAGHTVVTPEGKRHVFHHIGSGSFAGTATFLSRFFVVNPFLFQKELDELDFLPNVLIDHRAPMTTPFDMLINQELEAYRGNFRHGSCGVGLGETMERIERRPEFATFAGDAFRPMELNRKLFDIGSQYVPLRLAELGVPISDKTKQRCNMHLIESFAEAVGVMSNSMCVNPTALMGCGAVVFEGAQGLLLDQGHEYFPHVTRSKTGLANVKSLCDEMGINDLDVSYVTRAYMTRHGPGPFKTEAEFSFEDATNIPNQYQGHLRFGNLDTELLGKSIKNDLAHFSNARPSIFVTCADQMATKYSDIIRDTGLKFSHTSYGPSRKDVVEI